MRLKLWIYLAGIACGGLLLTGSAKATDPANVLTDLKKAIQTEIEAQKKADAWSREKELLVNEIRQIKTQLDWVTYQNTKYVAYIEHEKETVQKLQQKKDEMENLRQDLEPHLDEIIERIEQFIKNDMTFLSEERSKRLRFLKDSANDFHLSMSEKLHRVLEALLVEAEYGRSLEVNTETLLIKGQSIEADVLRVGRIALFYHSLDGEKVGRWNEKTQQWEPISTHFERAIKDTLEMARQQKSVELVDLPIGGF